MSRDRESHRGGGEPRPEQGSNSHEIQSSKEQRLAEIVKCEEMIAEAALAQFEKRGNLSEGEELAAAFGLGLAATYLLGLKSPISDRAKEVIESIYLAMENPYDNNGLIDCLKSFGSVPSDSQLPSAVAKEMHRYETARFDENDPLGESLDFFQWCSSSQIKEHLVPLIDSHKDETVQRKIAKKLLEFCPEKIPVEEYLNELQGILTDDLTLFSTRRGEALLSYLSASSLLRDNFKKVLEHVMECTSLETDHNSRDMADHVVRLTLQDNLATPTISAFVRERISLALEDRGKTRVPESFFAYEKRYHPDDYEELAVNFVVEAAKYLGKKERAQISYALRHLDEVTTESSFWALSDTVLDDIHIRRVPSKSIAVDLLAQSPFQELKNKFAIQFLEASTEILAKRFDLDDLYEDPSRYKFRAESTPYRYVVETLAGGGLTGDEVLNVLKDVLHEEREECNHRQLFAAWLLAGHSSPEAEKLLFQTLSEAKDVKLREVIAESLSKCRNSTTPELLKLAWGEDVELARLAVRSFTGTTDPKEILATKHLFEGYIRKAEKKDKQAEKLCVDVLQALKTSPGSDVNEIFLRSLRSTNYTLIREATIICFPTSDEKFPYMIYREGEDQLQLARMILEDSESPLELTRKAILRLQNDLYREDLRSVIEARMKSEINDEIYGYCFSALVSQCDPSQIEELLHFFSLRERDPANRPSVIQIGPKWNHLATNMGDQKVLENAMNAFAEGKRVQLESLDL